MLSTETIASNSFSILRRCSISFVLQPKLDVATAVLIPCFLASSRSGFTFGCLSSCVLRISISFLPVLRESSSGL